jgi:tetratricopeptide (TPR) repeat protein
MSRFSHLEFDGKRDPGSKGGADGAQKSGTGEPVRDAHFFYERAKGFWLAGNFEEALANYSRTLEKNSAFYEGWLGQVRMLIEMGEYPEAKIWSDKALELFPEHPELFSAKAIACVRDAEFDKAQAYCDNAIQKQGATWYVWLARAEVLLARRSRMAQTCLANAVNQAKGDAPLVRLEAGRVLARYQHYSSALEYLRPTIGDFPKAALAWYELGRCQARLGMPEAERVLNECVKLRPGWVLPARERDQFWRRGLGSRLSCFFRRLFGR